MTARFNPPPGWTLAGLGALPEADWEPTEAAPPAPPTWPFYLDDRGYETSAPPGAWQPPEAVVASVPAAPGRHRKRRHRSRWRMLLLVLPLIATMVTVLALAALRG